MEEITDEELDERIKTAQGYELADLLREKIRRRGWKIEDTKDGPKLTKIK